VGWLFDINFKETKFMLMKRGIPAMMVKELRQQPWMDAKVMDEVEEVVKWWEKEYQCPVA
jgi:hypothetical protein